MIPGECYITLAAVDIWRLSSTWSSNVMSIYTQERMVDGPHCISRLLKAIWKLCGISYTIAMLM